MFGPASCHRADSSAVRTSAPTGWLTSGLVLILAFVPALYVACSGDGGEKAIPAMTSAPTSPEGLGTLPEEDDRFRVRRLSMVAETLMRLGIEDSRVLAALQTVPRHLFVPDAYIQRAYNNLALPIGEGQTISQPYVVALMSELLDVKPGEKVLEVGTGSGYQAAVLAEMGAEVYSVEIIPVLAQRARELLDSLGYGDVRTRLGDGYYGWGEEAPFDGIIVTAAPDHVPSDLVAELKPGGKMVIPVGPPGSVQSLWLVEQREGQWVFLNQGPVRFVTLVREAPR